MDMRGEVNKKEKGTTKKSQETNVEVRKLGPLETEVTSNPFYSLLFHLNLLLLKSTIASFLVSLALPPMLKSCIKGLSFGTSCIS